MGLAKYHEQSRGGREVMITRGTGTLGGGMGGSKVSRGGGGGGGGGRGGGGGARNGKKKKRNIICYGRNLYLRDGWFYNFFFCDIFG